MECGFGEARHEHVRIVDGGRIFESWRTLTREPQAPQQMMEELNNTVDTLIAQLTQITWLPSLFEGIRQGQMHDVTFVKSTVI